MDPTQGHDADQDSGLTPEQEAAADAEFEAGFAGVHGDEPAPQATTSQDDADDAGDQATGEAVDGAQASAEDEAAAAAAAQAEAERKAREEADAPVTITKAQLNRLLAIADEVPTLHDRIARTHDTVAGKLGSLQQTVKNLQEKAGRGNLASIKQLKRLEGEYPELAQLMTEDLNEAFSQGQGEAQAEAKGEQQAEAQQPVNPLDAPEVQQVLRQKETAITEAIHPGFQQLARTPEFTEWVSTLPPVAVDLLNSSWDSSVMVPAFADFKRWKAEQDAKRASNATTKQQNDKRLEAAIAPTDGAARSGMHVVDEDAAFAAGFNRVRKS